MPMKTTITKNDIESYIREYRQIIFENYSECNLRDRSLYLGIHRLACDEALDILYNMEYDYCTYISKLNDASFKCGRYAKISKTVESEKMFEVLKDEIDEIIFYIRFQVEE